MPSGLTTARLVLEDWRMRAEQQGGNLRLTASTQAGEVDRGEFDPFQGGNDEETARVRQAV